MTDPFSVASSERGVVRIFTTDLSVEGNSAITPENVHKLLGDRLELDASRIEVFPSTVLETMGLSSYLEEGYGIPKSDLAGTSAALDALKGLVILVASAAFRGQSATLNPKSGIRFVGAFQELLSAPPRSMAPPESVEGKLEENSGASSLGTSRVRNWPIILLALLAAATLVLFLAI